MNYIYIGKYVNTHGIKGEIRILSDEDNKELIFKKGLNIYVGSNKINYVIKTYRKHKNYDMLTLEGVDNINDIIDLRGSSIYINRLDIDKNVLFKEEYIGMEVYSNSLVGKVIDILKSVKYDILVVKGNKKVMIPKIDQFIKKIDIENRIIYINSIKGLVDED